MDIYGYPTGLIHSGHYCRTEAEANSLRDMIVTDANQVSVIKENRDFYNDRWNPWYRVEPCPHYTYTTNKLEAEWQKNNNHCYRNLRDFNILKVKVETVGLLMDNNKASKLIVYGSIPLIWGYKDRPGFRIIRLVSYSPFNSGIEFKPVLHEGIPVYTEDAATLILKIQGADGGELNGLSFRDLLNIQELISSRSLIKNLHENKPYRTDEVQCKTYRLKDGKNLSLYIYSVGYSEGYAFEVYSSEKDSRRAFRENIRARMKSDWVLLECFECGATYTEAGHVEPGGMGCDHCS